ncbi:unnamed protein product [Linum trigynum]|uniref:Uncharacterized protein n=1 Tax=Linum trigynum TaxID=586398 RepID=A0AAV2DIB9_9ROSI
MATPSARPGAFRQAPNLEWGSWNLTPSARRLTLSGHMVTCSFSEVPDLQLGTWHLTPSARRLAPHSFSEVPNLQWGAWPLSPSARRLTLSGAHGDAPLPRCLTFG